MQGDRCSEVLNYGSMLSLLPTVILVAFVDTSGTPKHVSAEDVELFRQACHISRQVFDFHLHFLRLFLSLMLHILC